MLQDLALLSNLRVLILVSWSADEMPESIKALTGLQAFHCTQSSSLRSLPEALGALTHLQVLNLKECTRLRALPESVSQLSGLQHLNLDRCYALNPHGGTTKLVQLLLDGCPDLKLRGPGPPQIFKNFSGVGQFWATLPEGRLLPD